MPPAAQRTCLKCGSQFQTAQHRINRGGGKYCSQKCYETRPPKPIEKRFWSKVSKTETCWVWTGAHGQSGHGVVSTGQKSTQASRISWELHFGTIPNGLMICHHCDNPPCVRPDHLFLGTQKDNMKDSCVKYRQQKKYTPGTIRLIRSRYANGTNTIVLAKDYGIPHYYIKRIIIRRVWKHLD